MTPPSPGNLSLLRNRGAKMMVYHGTSDPIFSSDDTTAWYDTLTANYGGTAPNGARFVVGDAHAPALPLSESGALHEQQRRAGGKLHLPMSLPSRVSTTLRDPP